MIEIKAPCRGQFRIFRSKLKWMYWVIFTHLHHDLSLQKMISKEWSLSVKKIERKEARQYNVYNNFESLG